mgnify:CR=1 FL=1
MSKIFIQDNFFDHNVLKEIQQKMLTSEFKSRYQDTLHDDQQNNNLYQRNYHHIALPDESDVSLEVKKNITQLFKKNIVVEGNIKNNLYSSAIKSGMEGGNIILGLSLIHISEPTRLRRISYAVFCL